MAAEARAAVHAAKRRLQENSNALDVARRRSKTTSLVFEDLAQSTLRVALVMSASLNSLGIDWPFRGYSVGRK